MMLGRLLSFWNSKFSGAMLNFQGVLHESLKDWTTINCDSLIETFKMSTWVSRNSLCLNRLQQIMSTINSPSGKQEAKKTKTKPGGKELNNWDVFDKSHTCVIRKVILWKWKLTSPAPKAPDRFRAAWRGSVSAAAWAKQSCQGCPSQPPHLPNNSSAGNAGPTNRAHLWIRTGLLPFYTKNWEHQDTKHVEIELNLWFWYKWTSRRS